MKATKRVLCVALVLLLGLALLVPAAANEPVTEVKKSPPPILFVFTGDTLKLEIDMEVTEDGVPVELECAWYDYAFDPYEGETSPPIATGPVLELPVTTQLVPRAVATQTYCVVINRVTAEGTYNLASYTTDVHMYISIRHIPALWRQIIMEYFSDPTTINIVLASLSPIMLVLSTFMVPILLFFRLSALAI